MFSDAISHKILHYVRIIRRALCTEKVYKQGRQKTRSERHDNDNVQCVRVIFFSSPNLFLLIPTSNTNLLN